MQVRLKTATPARLILLLSCWTSISSANIVLRGNPLGIDWSPAPSPEDGPPLSAGASRNRALLPAQICGIVGAYLLSVLIVCLALVLLRRKRNRIEIIGKEVEIEMVNSHCQPYCVSTYPGSTTASPRGFPASPRNFSWPSPEKSDRTPYIYPSSIGSPRSPPGGGDPAVDKRIVEADREMLQRDLEDIYAHVMEQEEAKAAGVKLEEMPPPLRLQNIVPTLPPQRQNTPTKKIEKVRPSNLQIEDPKSSKSHSRSSSIISSIISPKRKGVRGMQISAPVLTPLSSGFPAAGTGSDEEPLSPRFYSPPPPPPIPKDQVPYGHTHGSSRDSPTSPTRSIAEQLSHFGASVGSPSHRPNHSQTSIQSSRDASSATSATSQTPFIPDLSHWPKQTLQPPPKKSTKNSSFNIPSQGPSNNSSAGGLPLRQYEPALQSPSFSYTTKTTILEKVSPLSPGLTTGGGLRTPWSAGAVPYSPYQPFTPMVPITPRLVTKEDRKAMKKKEGRVPVLEMIKSEDELFDSAY